MKIWKEKEKGTNGTIWRADFTFRKKRYRLDAYTKEDLTDLINQLKANAARKQAGLNTRAPLVTISQLVAEHTRDFNLDVKYYRRGKVVLKMFEKNVGGETAVAEIVTADVKAYTRYRRSQNPSLQSSSINKDLTYISAMLSAAPEYFRALKDYSPPKLPWERESTRPNPRVIYKEETDKLLEYLRYPGVRRGEKANSPEIRGDYADMYELAMNSSMRWGEVAQLEWSMVNLKASEIVLPPRITKTEEPRIVPLNSRAKEIMSARAKNKRTIWIFPRADGQTYRKHYYDRLRSIAKKIGLPFGRGIGFTLHTTRHSAISRMLDRGVDIATIQQISGHTDRTIAMRYTHSSRKRVHDAVEKLVDE